MSVRKPYNINAGYIASRKFRGSYIVIYNAQAQNVDVDGKYAVVCETHSRLVGTTSIPKARQIMKNPDFCEMCMPEAFASE